MGQGQVTDAALLLRAVGIDQLAVQKNGHIFLIGVQLEDGVAVDVFLQNPGKIEGLPGLNVAAKAAKAIGLQQHRSIPLLGEHGPPLLVIFPSLRHCLPFPPEGQIVALILPHRKWVAK